MIFTITRLPVYEPLVSYRINRESPESSSADNLRVSGVASLFATAIASTTPNAAANVDCRVRLHV
jgi:hypothetical protein